MLLLLILSIIAASLSCNKTLRNTHLLPGDSVPDFIVFLADGNPVTKESLSGKPSVIVIFDVFSQKNRDMLCEMQRITARWRDNVNVLTVCENGDPQSGALIWNDWGLDIPVAIDGDAKVLRLFNGGNKCNIPQIFCVTSDGKVERYYEEDGKYGYLRIEKEFIIPQIINTSCEENI